MKLGWVLGKPLGRVCGVGRGGKRFSWIGFWPRFCSVGEKLRFGLPRESIVGGKAVVDLRETREKGGYDDISHGQVND